MKNNTIVWALRACLSGLAVLLGGCPIPQPVEIDPPPMENPDPSIPSPTENPEPSTPLQVSITGAETASENTTIMLTGNESMERENLNYRWEQVNPAPGRPPARIANPSTRRTAITLPYAEEARETITFRLIASLANSGAVGNSNAGAAGGTNGAPATAGTATGSAEHSITLVRGNIDTDSDGLIDIRGLSMLHNMRYSTGSGTNGIVEYKTSESDAGVTSGCPSGECWGYELLYDLDFDTNDTDNTASTRDNVNPTWTIFADGTYTLDADDNQAPYFVVAEGGWKPIGSSVPFGNSDQFRAIFEGNGYSIHNLAIIGQSTGSSRIAGIFPRGSQYGFFGAINGHIRNVHLVNAFVIGPSGDFRSTGALVGLSSGSVVASSSSGFVASASNCAGGLVGGVLSSLESTARVVASYSRATVASSEVTIGGLVCDIGEGANIRASYASGIVQSTRGGVGSLLGFVGNGGNITASYATGNARGPRGTGNFLGYHFTAPTITESYGFGMVIDTDGGENDFAPNDYETDPPGSPPITMPSQLTASDAGSAWNSAMHSTAGAWNFTHRAANGGPSLMYADYDGAGTTYQCANTVNPASLPPRSTILVANCGQALPHQQ